jgi:peptidoglycan/LPS O-acetylase OafA/YrhL
VILGWLPLLPDEYETLFRHVASGSAFVSNFTLLSETGYFDKSTDLKPLAHLWSLGIEEQFYILWPALLLLWSRARKSPFALILVIAALSFGLNMLLIGRHADDAFFLPVSRFWELMLGAAIIFIPKRVTGAAAVTSISGL